MTDFHGFETMPIGLISVSLTEDIHKIITAAQRDLGLFDANNLSGMSAYDVIVENLNLLRNNGVSESTIQALESMLTKFLYSNNIK